MSPHSLTNGLLTLWLLYVTVPMERAPDRRVLAVATMPDTTADSWLSRSARAIGLPSNSGKVLHVVELAARFLTDQSDRPEGPYIMESTTDSVWLDLATGVERRVVVAPYGGRHDTYLRSAHATFRVTGSQLVPDARLHGQLWSRRAFDPWAMLGDWMRDTGVRIASPRRLLGGERTVLERRGPFGVERLFLDSRTAIPVELDRTEPHYFLGPTHVEYVYATWSEAGPAMLYPVSVTRLVDGRVNESRFTLLPDRGGLMARDSGPSLVVPDSSLSLPIEPQLRFPTDAPDTVAVGANTYLLASRAFTSVVSLQRDTVFLLDAPAGEVRARQDREWVKRLFPGDRPVVLVTLNHVWPHIAGLRYWVAHGATVVAPRSIVPFLDSTLSRHWTALPDEYERTRSTRLPRTLAVKDSLSLAAGNVRVFAMEGLNGEGVLLAAIGPAHFIWASDHIQVIDAPTIYLEDVRRTVAQHRLKPSWTSGPHFRLVPWTQIDTLPHMLPSQ